ncbi:hypothetical protein FA15DRAFT_709506 [Coprinopsis marcescibilis]|uniref:HMG box domain-containing protein n=1 Tax=Coprinopsis marcescibilis TaxID=230819 RepID=A0A5C3KGM3_COPMA|nr:hypothetical protein FA15DRAFT_709506 [Coprinopsis marcescibilis]
MPALRTRDTQPRSLEVTTDAPAPPTFAIVSPTPRSFTFPISHNLSSHSPYSSPSSSPFEPDREPLPEFPAFASNQFVSGPVSIPTPPPIPQLPYIRAATPESQRSSSPTPSYKRRKSSCSSDTSERRPKKGDEDYIKRPENAFILFRRKCCEDRQQAQEEASQLADGPLKKQRQADLSKTISQQWKGLGAEERQYWETLAKEKKKEHEQMYPNYVYRPQRQKDKDGRSKNKKSPLSGKRRDDSVDGERSVSFVVPAPRHLGRSASAPTPPPYLNIFVPEVLHLTPSAPTSPSLSLVPFITRHSSSSIDTSNNFDFVSKHAYVSPPSASEAAQASLPSFLHASDFMQHMFTVPSQMSRKPAGPSPLQQLIMQQNALAQQMQAPNHGMSESNSAPIPPNLDMVSPASSISSGSSGPSSPTTGGPFTPSIGPLDPSAFLAMSSHDFSFGCPSQAELDLQAEMQMQNDFSQFTWDWPAGAPPVLDNNWDINSIPTALLGDPAMLFAGHPNPKDMCGTGIEFGQDFAQALEGGYNDSAMLGYDDLMSGNAFAAAA